MDYSVKPIVKWPGKLRTRRMQDSFKTSYSKTLDLLDREIRSLNGRRIVIQLALEFGQIRNDGRPYADAKPTHPGVIVTFESKHGPLSYHTDKYEDWRGNVRAIALALEALRAVDRYGVSGEGAQYTGYKQLPAAAWDSSNGVKLHTPAEAAAFISKFSGVTAAAILAESGVFELAVKAARRKAHPDAGGSDADFVRLAEAEKIIKERLR